MELGKVVSFSGDELKKYKYCPYCGSGKTLTFVTFEHFIMMECIKCNRGTSYGKLG